MFLQNLKHFFYIMNGKILKRDKKSQRSERVLFWIASRLSKLASLGLNPYRKGQMWIGNSFLLKYVPTPEKKNRIIASCDKFKPVVNHIKLKNL